VAASIGRHDVERKCVTAENLTLEKTVIVVRTMNPSRILLLYSDGQHL
jgi:hypothetical protein